MEKTKNYKEEQLDFRIEDLIGEEMPELTQPQIATDLTVSETETVTPATNAEETKS